LRWITELKPRRALYTGGVRRQIAAALVVVIAIVTLADPLWCADGCRERPINAVHHLNLSGASDDCATCQVPLSPQLIVRLQPAVKLIVPIAPSDESPVGLCNLDPLERPPRFV
jgi:hypothetical protein